LFLFASLFADVNRAKRDLHLRLFFFKNSIASRREATRRDRKN